jgi:sugar lactone lactonase YvrE
MVAPEQRHRRAPTGERTEMTMNSSVRTSSAARWLRRVALPLLILTALVAAQTPAVAVPPSGDQPASVILLPGASSAEGIAKGEGSTFYAGDLLSGDIFRGNVRHGTAERFIQAPQSRMAVGMAFDHRHDLLFVAGGPGQAFVYDTRSGAAVASYTFRTENSFINDVTVTAEGAWFTDSLQPVLYFVPLDKRGTPGEFQELQLSGPAADISGEVNLNGIRAADQGRTLIVAHSGNAALYTVNPETGASAAIAGISVPNVDGIELSGKNLWAVQNFSNQITRIRLNDDLTSGTVVKVITSDAFQVPTTAARFGNLLAVVNAKFDTGFPPTADQYEVVLVDN